MQTNKLTRRSVLSTIGAGFGMLGFANAATVAAKGPHFPAKAKHVIFLFLNGGPSQVDTFDPKPMLTKYHGKPIPSGNLKTERKTGSLLGSPFTFKKYGQSGIEVSEIFPKLGECIDQVCVIRSMYTDRPNHEPSLFMMNCGDKFRAARQWARGLLMVWEPIIKTCLVSWCYAQASPSSDISFGAQHFCLRYIRERTFRIAKPSRRS
jgi:hypothetical protein